MVISKEFTDIADMTEEWYEVRHTVRPHCNRYEEIWRYPKADPDLYLPKCNQLIPKSFKVHEREHIDSLYPTIKKVTATNLYNRIFMTINLSFLVQISVLVLIVF